MLDTETTGINISDGNRIIEIGAVEVINRELTGNNGLGGTGRPLGLLDPNADLPANRCLGLAGYRTSKRALAVMDRGG